MKRFLVLIAAAALVPAALLTNAAPVSAQAAAASLTINLTGIEQPKGRIMIALFDSQPSYDSGKPLRGIAVEVIADTASTVVSGLAPGRYAIKLFHDINGNGKMDSNPFGMPIEPFAFSNNAKGNMGPAKWDVASFEVTAGPTTHTIAIK